MAASLVSIFVNYLLNWTFLRVLGWGHGGLAFSTSLVASFNFLALFWLMRNKIGGMEGRRLSWGLLKIIAASALMGLSCWLSSGTIQDVFGDGSMGRLVNLVVSVPLGLAVLYGSCRFLRVQELEEAQKAIAGRLGGRAPDWPGSEG